MGSDRVYLRVLFFRELPWHTGVLVGPMGKADFDWEIKDVPLFILMVIIVGFVEEFVVGIWLSMLGFA